MLVFSTHAFTEGDVLSSFFGWLYAISTHAFTEGDGVQLKRKFYWKRISTHAFTEGDISAPRVLEYECISTHAFTEGDRFYLDYFIACIISTHAFTEGDISSIPANSSSSSNHRYLNHPRLALIDFVFFALSSPRKMIFCPVGL